MNRKYAELIQKLGWIYKADRPKMSFAGQFIAMDERIWVADPYTTALRIYDANGRLYRVHQVILLERERHLLKSGRTSCEQLLDYNALPEPGFSGRAFDAEPGARTPEFSIDFMEESK